MEESKKKLIVILLITTALFGYSFYDFIDKTGLKDEPETATLSSDNAKTLTSSECIVYVSGAVNRPGVFKISSESRFFDAINSAGGLTSRADVEKINMAQQVKDGIHINVPTKEKPPPEVLAELAESALKSDGSSPEELIKINTASKDDLEKLPGIGPALAQRIIDYRTANGPFSETSDILKVSGIGEAKFNRLKDKIRL